MTMKDSAESKREQVEAYVLDQLPEPERRAMEAACAEDAVLCAEVRRLRESLYGPARSLRGEGAGVAVWETIRERALGAEAKGAEAKEAVGPRWGWIWGVAALLLLGINLWLAGLVLREDVTVGEGDGEAPGGRLAAGDSAMEAGEAGPGLAAEIERLRTEVAVQESRLRQARMDLAERGERETELRKAAREWEAAYERAEARQRPFYEGREGLGRFTVIELVGRAGDQRPMPHRGFADLAGRFLMDGARIAGANPEAFVGPVVEGAGVQSPTGVRPEADLPVVETGGGDLVAGERDDPGSGWRPGEEEAVAGGDEDWMGGEAAGFTVWRDDEQKGFLDVYNLPVPGEGREAYLWVRGSEVEPYIPVGAVPQLEDGSGSFFYSVEEPEFTPSEILITEEAAGASGEAPSGPVLLRGP